MRFVCVARRAATHRHGQMRPYQLEGLAFFSELHSSGLSGGILADEMVSVSLLVKLMHMCAYVRVCVRVRVCVCVCARARVCVRACRLHSPRRT